MVASYNPLRCIHCIPFEQVPCLLSTLQNYKPDSLDPVSAEASVTIDSARMLKSLASLFTQATLLAVLAAICHARSIFEPPGCSKVKPHLYLDRLR